MEMFLQFVVVASAAPLPSASAAAAVDACGLRAKIAAGFKWIALARQAEMKANKVHKQVARGAEEEEGEGKGGRRN